MVKPPSVALAEDCLRRVRDEVHASLRRADPEAAARLVDEIRAARTVFVAGAGRSGMMASALAMRLVHLGFDAHVVGESTTPALARGDLLVACSGSGDTATVLSIADVARATGGRVAAVTAAAGAPLTDRADLVLLLPEGERGYDAEETAQFMGTLFEQSSLLYFDAIVLALEQGSPVTQAQMRDRHTNLE
ncbi:6-phospho-3-hexuloisomerase [Actinomadura hibisca]|uniref:6-phospho-3-hexuloisomerase n=1 Tax=Actinomadura hibisca TaxID=68565 RepID=UPI00082AD8AF|nr:6-phospho-3-hexuloisomerase [Actinomadura hibisca]